jgi:hypothetical protein
VAPLDRRACICDTQARRVDRIESREQNIIESRLELAREIAAQAAGPSSPEQARMRAEQTREQKAGEQKRCEYDEGDGDRSEDRKVHARERRV